jgi:hypothetical protein
LDSEEKIEIEQKIQIISTFGEPKWTGRQKCRLFLFLARDLVVASLTISKVIFQKDALGSG